MKLIKMCISLICLLVWSVSQGEIEQWQKGRAVKRLIETLGIGNQRRGTNEDLFSVSGFNKENWRLLVQKYGDIVWVGRCFERCKDDTEVKNKRSVAWGEDGWDGHDYWRCKRFRSAFRRTMDRSDGEKRCDDCR